MEQNIASCKSIAVVEASKIWTEMVKNGPEIAWQLDPIMARTWSYWTLDDNFLLAIQTFLVKIWAISDF